MKNKKLRNGLLCALAVPCMFMATACDSDKRVDISANEYTDLVYESGKNYIAKHTDYKTFGDMTTTFTNTGSSCEKVEVYYKESATASSTTNKEFDKTSTRDDKQTIEINRDETENGDISVRITTTSISTTTGKRANYDTWLLESYETSSVETTVETLLKEGETYKYYKYEKEVEKETGEEDVVTETKNVYTFSSQAEFQEAIEYIIEKVNENQVFDMLSSDEMILVSPDTYKEGDDFGLSYTYSGASTKGDEMMEKSVMSASIEFDNMLPSEYGVEMKGNSSDGEYSDYKQKIKVTYSASAITTPEGSSDYTTSALDYTDIYVESLGF